MHHCFGQIKHGQWLVVSLLLPDLPIKKLEAGCNIKLSPGKNPKIKESKGKAQVSKYLFTGREIYVFECS